MHLSRKPLSIKVRVGTRIPVRARLNIIRNSQAPFSHYRRRVAVAIIAARITDIAIVRYVDTGIPLQIAVVVIGRVVQVIDVLVRITGAPELIHHLDMEVIGLVDAGASFVRADSLDDSALAIHVFPEE